MLFQRAAVTLTLGPLALWLIYLGGWALFVPLIVLMLIASVEFGRMLRALDLHYPQLLVSTFIAILYIVPMVTIGDDALVWSTLTLFIGFVLITLTALFNYETGKERAALSLFTSFGTVMLIGWLGMHILLLRNIDPASGSSSWEWTMIAILATWSADVGAYLVGSFLTGRVLGRHAFTPRLSPKKTYEGFFGGIVFSATLATAVGTIAFGMPPLLVLALSLCLAAIGTMGDLVISLVKRESGIKDSGNIFPGHGGALDRLDSILWSMAFAYYFVRFLT